jgi:hypothetical protein
MEGEHTSDVVVRLLRGYVTAENREARDHDR